MTRIVGLTESVPARPLRVDLATGRRVLWKELRPSQATGVTNGLRVGRHTITLTGNDRDLNPASDSRTVEMK